MKQLERDRGDKWAAKRHAMGGWTQKLHAAGLTGIPDWLLADIHLYLVEAKAAVDGPVAYDPEQLRTGQAWFLKTLARYAPKAGMVVVLGAQGYVELRWPESHRKLHRGDFLERLVPYEEQT